MTKAATVLLGASVIVWFLRYFSPDFQQAKTMSDSILAVIGSLLAPVFTWCGFGDWRPTVSLMSGLVAKESIVSTMRILSSAGGGNGLSGVLPQCFTAVSAYSFMIFVLLYTPCSATLATIKKETGSLKWTCAVIAYQFGIAWLVSALFYQFVTLAGHIFSFAI